MRSGGWLLATTLMACGPAGGSAVQSASTTTASTAGAVPAPTAPASTVAATPSASAPPAASSSAPPAALDARMRVQVDRRIEIISMLFALAGNNEYMHPIGTPYAKAAIQHFLPYAKHNAVVTSKQLHDRHRIGFDGPVTLAIQLDDNLKATQPFDPLPVGLSTTWTGVLIDKYLDMLRDFVVASHFDDFWNQQAPYVAKVSQAYQTYVANKGLLPWFDSVFGKKDKAAYLIAPSMMSGLNNWGIHAVRPDGTEHVVQVMSLIKVDNDGIPQLDDNVAWVLGHELSHPYVNPMVDKNIDALKDPLARALESVQAIMAKQHYTTPTILGYESLARAMQIMYVGERLGKEQAQKVMDEQVKILQFLWLPDLVTALNQARAKAGGRLTEATVVGSLKDVLVAYNAKASGH
jgi:hypothetical protein